MIGFQGKHIIGAEDTFLDVKIEDIKKYLSEVKNAVHIGRYQIDRNRNRQDNCYVIVISFHEQKYPLNYYFK